MDSFGIYPANLRNGGASHARRSCLRTRWISGLPAWTVVAGRNSLAILETAEQLWFESKIRIMVPKGTPSTSRGGVTGTAQLKVVVRTITSAVNQTRMSIIGTGTLGLGAITGSRSFSSASGKIWITWRR